MTGQKRTILRTDHLKAFYILEMHGTQKIVKAVNDVDMTIYENEIYGIAGESEGHRSRIKRRSRAVRQNVSCPWDATSASGRFL